jgi:predicted transcriptional regulator of viral defense system
MKYQELDRIINKPYFSKNDLDLKDYNIYNYQLTTWCKKGYLLKIKNNIYVFKNRMENLRSEELAGILYEPSYISLEFALNQYNIIPEIVFAITCITSTINRNFKNQMGQYIYKHVKSELFFGYKAVKTKNGYYYLAEPEKAILDYLYLNLSRINNISEFNELRFNIEEINELIDKEKFINYLNVFNIKKLKEIALLCLQ